MGIETITNILDKIPILISGIRKVVITLFDKLNLPDNSYMLVFLTLALFLSYYWIKQWITYSVFTKFSTILNWILLSLLLYVTFLYVGV